MNLIIEPGFIQIDIPGASSTIAFFLALYMGSMIVRLVVNVIKALPFL